MTAGGGNFFAANKKSARANLRSIIASNLKARKASQSFGKKVTVGKVAKLADTNLLARSQTGGRSHGHDAARSARPASVARVDLHHAASKKESLLHQPVSDLQSRQEIPFAVRETLDQVPAYTHFQHLNLDGFKARDEVKKVRQVPLTNPSPYGAANLPAYTPYDNARMLTQPSGVQSHPVLPFVKFQSPPSASYYHSMGKVHQPASNLDQKGMHKRYDNLIRHRKDLKPSKSSTIQVAKNEIVLRSHYDNDGTDLQHLQIREEGPTELPHSRPRSNIGHRPHLLSDRHH